jgi:hypothetical protein
MKQLINFNPLFTPGPAGAGKLDFSMWPGFAASKLYAVIDLTTNTPIYIPGAPGLGSAVVNNPLGNPSSAVGSIITLQANTSNCSTTDDLSIFYDTQTPVENNNAQENGGQLSQIQENTAQILRELVIMNFILCQGMNVGYDDVTKLRHEINNPQNTDFSNATQW